MFLAVQSVANEVVEDIHDSGLWATGSLGTTNLSFAGPEGLVKEEKLVVGLKYRTEHLEVRLGFPL